MANAKRCDRCGSFYIQEELPKFDFSDMTPGGFKPGTSRLAVNIEHNSSATAVVSRPFDLCRDCQTKIYNFLTKEELL